MLLKLCKKTLKHFKRVKKIKATLQKTARNALAKSESPRQNILNLQAKAWQISAKPQPCFPKAPEKAFCPIATLRLPAACADSPSAFAPIFFLRPEKPKRKEPAQAAGPFGGKFAKLGKLGAHELGESRRVASDSVCDNFRRKFRPRSLLVPI